MGLITVVVVQGVMTNDKVRFYLSWAERMEGQAVNLAEEVIAPLPEQGDSGVISPEAWLTLGIKDFSSLPKAVVLVNGKETVFFQDAQVKLHINARDVIEVDSTAYNFPVEYTVLSRSPNLSYPRQGQTFNGNRSMVMIGKIIVK